MIEFHSDSNQNGKVPHRLVYFYEHNSDLLKQLVCMCYGIVLAQLIGRNQIALGPFNSSSIALSSIHSLPQLYDVINNSQVGTTNEGKVRSPKTKMTVPSMRLGTDRLLISALPATKDIASYVRHNPSAQWIGGEKWPAMTSIDQHVRLFSNFSASQQLVAYVPTIEPNQSYGYKIDAILDSITWHSTILTTADKALKYLGSDYIAIDIGDHQQVIQDIASRRNEGVSTSCLHRVLLTEYYRHLRRILHQLTRANISVVVFATSASLPSFSMLGIDDGSKLQHRFVRLQDVLPASIISSMSPLLLQAVEAVICERARYFVGSSRSYLATVVSIRRVKHRKDFEGRSETTRLLNLDTLLVNPSQTTLQNICQDTRLSDSLTSMQSLPKTMNQPLALRSIVMAINIPTILPGNMSLYWGRALSESIRTFHERYGANCTIYLDADPVDSKVITSWQSEDPKQWSFTRIYLPRPPSDIIFNMTSYRWQLPPMEELRHRFDFLFVLDDVMLPAEGLLTMLETALKDNLDITCAPVFTNPKDASQQLVFYSRFTNRYQNGTLLGALPLHDQQGFIHDIWLHNWTIPVAQCATRAMLLSPRIFANPKVTFPRYTNFTITTIQDVLVQTGSLLVPGLHFGLLTHVLASSTSAEVFDRIEGIRMLIAPFNKQLTSGSDQEITDAMSHLSLYAPMPAICPCDDNFNHYLAPSSGRISMAAEIDGFPMPRNLTTTIPEPEGDPEAEAEAGVAHIHICIYTSVRPPEPIVWSSNFHLKYMERSLRFDFHHLVHRPGVYSVQGTCDVIIRVANVTDPAVDLETRKPCPGKCHTQYKDTRSGKRSQVPEVELSAYWLSVLQWRHFEDDTVALTCSLTLRASRSLIAHNGIKTSSVRDFMLSLFAVIAISRLTECGEHERIAMYPRRPIHTLAVIVGSETREWAMEAQELSYKYEESNRGLDAVVTWRATERLYRCRLGTTRCNMFGYTSDDDTFAPYLMDAFVRSEVNRKEYQAENGWACAQRRVMRALAHVLRLFDPQMLLVLDDDTFVNWPLTKAYMLKRNFSKPIAMGDHRWSIFFGGSGYIINRKAIEILVANEIYAGSMPKQMWYRYMPVKIFEEFIEKAPTQCVNQCFGQQPDTFDYISDRGRKIPMTVSLIDFCTNFMSAENTCHHSDHALSRCLLFGNSEIDVEYKGCGDMPGDYQMCFATVICDLEGMLTCHRYMPALNADGYVVPVVMRSKAYLPEESDHKLSRNTSNKATVAAPPSQRAITFLLEGSLSNQLAMATCGLVVAEYLGRSSVKFAGIHVHWNRTVYDKHTYPFHKFINISHLNHEVLPAIQANHVHVGEFLPSSIDGEFADQPDFFEYYTAYNEATEGPYLETFDGINMRTLPHVITIAPLFNSPHLVKWIDTFWSKFRFHDTIYRIAASAIDRLELRVKAYQHRYTCLYIPTRNTTTASSIEAMADHYLTQLQKLNISRHSPIFFMTDNHSKVKSAQWLTRSLLRFPSLKFLSSAVLKELLDGHYSLEFAKAIKLVICEHGSHLVASRGSDVAKYVMGRATGKTPKQAILVPEA